MTNSSEIDWAQVARKVRFSRISSGLQCGELAKRAGVGRNTLYRLESGYSIRVSTLKKILKVLILDVQKIYTKDVLNLKPEDAPYILHRASESVWYGADDARRVVPEDNDHLIQTPDERLRLGALGLVPSFTTNLNFVLERGPGAMFWEIYGETNVSVNPAFHDFMLFGLRGQVEIEIDGEIVTLSEGDVLGYGSDVPFIIRPVSLTPNPLILWVGANRAGKA